MKTKILFLALSAFGAFTACAKEFAPTIGQGEMITLSASTDVSSKTVLTQDGTVNWCEGDQIAVFTSSTDSKTNKGVFTLTSGAGTSAASFQGTLGTGDSPYYALYPNNSGALKGSGYNFYVAAEQSYVENSFANQAAVMVAQFDKLTDQIQFKNTCSVLRIQLKGTDKISKIILTDKAGMKITGKFFMALVNAGTDKQGFSANGENSSNVTLNCPEPVQLSPDAATAFHFIVPPGAFASGIDMAVFGPGGMPLKSFSTGASHKTSRAHVTVLSPLTVSTGSSVKDLSEVESANCYIVTGFGSYKFKAVKGNTSEALSGTGVEVLWETYGTTQAPAEGSVVTGAELKDGYITFGATGVAGNALIALKDGDKVVWSWHIWVPATKVRAAQYSNMASGGMMDRNLGALTAEPADPLSNGLMYQWGRKDPFPGAASYSAKNEEQAFSKSTLKEVTSSATTVGYSIAKPTTFFYCPGTVQSNGDWVWGGNNTNWGKDKTVYDPCPPGYVVPVQTAWDGLTITVDAGKYGAEVDQKHWYPYCGQRYNSDGSLHAASADGELWNSIAGTNQAYYMIYKSDGTVSLKKTAPRAQARAVRCYTATTPAVGQNEKKQFEDLPEGTSLTSISSVEGGYKLSFSNGFTYELKTSKAGLVQVSDDEYWVVNGVKSAYKHVALEYMTVGADGFWHKNGVKTSVRATPENTEAGEDDIYLTNVVENARTVEIRFSDESSLSFAKKISWDLYVKKSDKEMNVYMGHSNSNKWIRYRYIYRYKAYTGGTTYPDNYDNWGLNTPYSCTRNGDSFTDIECLFLSGEAEAAVQTDDARATSSSSYSGGVLHGWENMTSTGGVRDFKIEIDGVEVPENGTVSLKSASRVEIWQKTRIARAYSAVGENEYANVTKHWVLENGRVNIDVKYDFIADIKIYQAMFGMFCVKRLVTAKDESSGYVTNMARKDNTPNIIYSITEGWSQPSLSNKDNATRRFEAYGERGLSFAMVYDDGNMKSTGGFRMLTNGNNYNKMYCDICGNYNASVGESLYDTIGWEIDFISEYDAF